mgnify:CR=1 FL=1
MIPIPFIPGKFALVTGGSRGIGRSIAIELASRGANVAINFKTDSKGADSAKQIIINAGGTAESFYADIGSKIEFEINAVTGPALRFFPLYKKVSSSSQFTMDIYAHDVTSLIGAEIVFTYDNTPQSIQTVFYFGVFMSLLAITYLIWHKIYRISDF